MKTNPSVLGIAAVTLIGASIVLAAPPASQPGTVDPVPAAAQTPTPAAEATDVQPVPSGSPSAPPISQQTVNDAMVKLQAREATRKAEAATNPAVTQPSGGAVTSSDPADMRAEIMRLRRANYGLNEENRRLRAQVVQLANGHKEILDAMENAHREAMAAEAPTNDRGEVILGTSADEDDRYDRRRRDPALLPNTVLPLTPNGNATTPPTPADIERERVRAARRGQGASDAPGKTPAKAAAPNDTAPNQAPVNAAPAKSAPEPPAPAANPPAAPNNAPAPPGNNAPAPAKSAPPAAAK